INYVSWNPYTCIAYVDELTPAPSREGLFAGILTLTRTASQAGAGMLVGIVMQMSGFVSGQKVQTAEVSPTILMMLSVGSILV
ncbi:MFS transporter, partial [Enterobacter hormaechei]|nr:MFS transporter [Enterobacter hormaechei]